MGSIACLWFLFQVILSSTKNYVPVYRIFNLRDHQPPVLYTSIGQAERRVYILPMRLCGRRWIIDPMINCRKATTTPTNRESADDRARTYPMRLYSISSDDSRKTSTANGILLQALGGHKPAAGGPLGVGKTLAQYGYKSTDATTNAYRLGLAHFSDSIFALNARRIDLTLPVAEPEAIASRIRMNIRVA